MKFHVLLVANLDAGGTVRKNRSPRPLVNALGFCIEMWIGQGYSPSKTDGLLQFLLGLR